MTQTIEEVPVFNEKPLHQPCLRPGRENRQAPWSLRQEKLSSEAHNLASEMWDEEAVAHSGKIGGLT